MRKYLKLFFIFVVIAIMTGCYKLDTKMDIKSDKSMDFSLIFAIDIDAKENFELDEDVSDSEFSLGQEEFQELYGPKGYSVEEYKEKVDSNQYEGVKITKKYTNIDDVTKKTEKKILLSDFFSEEEIFDDSQLFSISNGVYKAEFVFDFSSNSDMVPPSVQNTFDLKYTVVLPEKSISNNATTVSKDGKTLTWELDGTKKNDINFKFSLEPQNPILSFVKDNMLIIIGAVLLIVVIIIFIIVKGKKGSSNPNLPIDNKIQTYNEPIVSNPQVGNFIPKEIIGSNSAVSNIPSEPINNVPIVDNVPSVSVNNNPEVSNMPSVPINNVPIVNNVPTESINNVSIDNISSESVNNNSNMNIN